MQKGFKKTALAVSISMSAFSWQANAGESMKGVNNQSKPVSETERLLLQELTKMNARIEQLNKKVTQFESERKNTSLTTPKGIHFASLNQPSSVKSDAAPVYKKSPVNHLEQKSLQSKINQNGTNYKTIQYINNQNHVKNSKEDTKFYQYLDKKYYNISPEELNRTSYFQIVNQNSPVSTAYNNLCINNALCFSALSNFDLRYYSRVGGIDILGNSVIPSLIGVGVRPVFGQIDENIVGSANNANLFIDGYINPYATAHMNFVYVNGSVKGRFFAHNESDWSSVYRSAAAIKMDEVFGTLIVPNTPFFVRVGKQYLNFGDYKPYPITESLVQLLTQMRSGAIIGGAVLPNGLYASANFSMARQSLENISHPIGEPFYNTEKDRNYGYKIGYEGTINNVLVNVNASYIYDLRDSDYLNESAYIWTYDIARGDALFGRGLTFNQAFVMERSPGVAAHIDMHWKQLGMLAEFATATSKMSPSPYSQIRAWGVHGNLGFNLLGYSSLADLGYERGYNAQVYQTLVYGPLLIIPGLPLPLQLGNALPKNRVVGTYSVVVMPEVTLSAQWVHDKDFPLSLMGSNRTSDLGILRVSAQL